jgi:hypothetical protein
MTTFDLDKELQERVIDMLSHSQPGRKVVFLVRKYSFDNSVSFFVLFLALGVKVLLQHF